MKYLKTLFTVLLVVITTAAFAQSKTLSKANKFYKNKEYAAAIPLYEKSLEEKSSVSTQTKLAFCYKSVNQIDKAEKLYSDIVYADKPKPITFYYYGEALMRNGKYAAAKFWFEEYLKKKPGDPKSLQMIESCDKVNLIRPYFGSVEATPFSQNSESDDNAPVMLGDQLVFCSDRKQKAKLLKQKSGVTGRDFIQIYQSQKEADGSFSEPTSFSSKINGLNKNTGPISFDASGSIAVFSKNGDVANKQGAYTLQLYEAVMEGGKWKNVELLNFCKPGFNYMHPAISPDGQMLFFISDRAGGSGGTEIYQCERKADGTWTRPVNLGDVVNTSGHEGFPFYNKEGQLFFSSKGHIGFGGYDIFFTTLDDMGNWTKPVNVGFPINSSSDDISIYVAEDGKSGLFTSGRSGTSDDIFLFALGSEMADTPSSNPIAVTTSTPAEPSIEKTVEINTPEIAIVEETISEVIPEPELVEKVVSEAPAPEMAVAPGLSEVMAEAETSVLEEIPSTPAPAEPEMILTEEVVETVEVEKTMVTPETIATEIPEAANSGVTAPAEKMVKTEMASIEPSTPSSRANKSKKTKKAKKKKNKKKSAVEKIEAPIKATVDTPKPEELTPDIQMPEVAAQIEEVVDTPEVETEEVSLTEMIAEMESNNTEEATELPSTTPTELRAETTEPVVADPMTAEPGSEGAAIIEPARLNTNPEMVEEVLTIEASDLSQEVVNLNTNTLEVFSGDLSANNISTEKQYEIPNVDYDFNGTEISRDLMVALDELANILVAHPSVEIQIAGHTASFGNNTKNQQLSEARARNAASYLMNKGIASNRIQSVGFGETQLLNECVDGILCSMDQHKINERLEVKVVRH